LDDDDNKRHHASTHTLQCQILDPKEKTKTHTHTLHPLHRATSKSANDEDSTPDKSAKGKDSTRDTFTGLQRIFAIKN
jgi:hypothetical protein